MTFLRQYDSVLAHEVHVDRAVFYRVWYTWHQPHRRYPSQIIRGRTLP